MSGGQLEGSTGYLGRLLDLLAVVGECPGLTLAELSRRTGIPPSTLSRLTNLLADRGFLRRLEGHGGFMPGPELELFGLRSLQRLTELGRFDACVDRLAAVSDESVSVGVLSGSRIVLVARRESMHPLRMVVRVGDVVPAHRTAMGKAILAHLPRDRRLALLEASGVECARPHLGALESELDAVREHGYAVDEGVFAVGLRCVGAAFFWGGGEPAGAISIAGPDARFSEQRARDAVPALRAEVEAISCELGHEPATPR
jgi:DNA-binding IclR family transcriptional regulator